MKIIEECNDFQIHLIEIKSAEYVGNLAINLFFSDGVNRLVNFKPFLEMSLHPSIRKYLEEERFKQFKIADGNLNWNDHDLIFPLGDLYQREI